jgi:N-methylhydantoinase A
MRYDGQGYDVTVPLDPRWLAKGDFAQLRAAFHAAHRATYGHANETAEIWFKELRAHILGVTHKPRILPLPPGGGATASRRPVRLFGRDLAAAVYERAALGPEQRITGPAIVNQMDTTTLIPPGWQAKRVGSGALVLERTGSTR